MTSPPTRTRRLLKLASLTASVAGEYAKNRLIGALQSDEEAQRTRARGHERSGRRIAQTLGELKGAVMKVGQMASMARDVLPRELAEALATLQRQAPAMDPATIAAQVERELGAAPERLFAEFSREPFAAASIGQVHRARTDDGREVVVKVQYPGVDGAVDSDLAQLRFAMRASGLLKLERRALDEVFEEVRSRLGEELDYCNEADNVRRFAERYRGRTDVIVPEVVGERSSQRVLTLTYEPGDALEHLDAAGYDQAARDRIGARLFEVLLEQLFEFRELHADPNPANFAFRRDGTLVIYDFGCVKRIDQGFLDAYRRLIAAGLDEDYREVDQALLALGARNPVEAAVDPAYYRRWRDLLVGPFLADRPFDFATATLHTQILALVPEFLAKHVGAFRPPKDLVFVDRVLVGHYHNLRALRARALLGPALRRRL